jgi:plastocyanin
MVRTPLVVAAGLVAASLALAVPAMARQSAATALTGTVGPGFTITLTKAGKKVSSLKPGSYAITVNDKGNIHDFHLMGPGVNKVITTVPFVGKKTVTVTLGKGTYTYQCDPHAASGMKATFKVAASSSSSSTTTTTTSATGSSGRTY